MKKRSSRQEAIRDIVRAKIVRAKEIRTQRVLVEELRAAGFDCTQATVSRDIADMGLRKLPEGVYVLAEDQHLQHMVSQLVVGVSRADNLVIIKAQPGTASGIAAAVDDAELPHIVGSLAGDDTILVITRTGEDGAQLEGMLNNAYPAADRLGGDARVVLSARSRVPQALTSAGFFSASSGAARSRIQPHRPQDYASMRVY